VDYDEELLKDIKSLSETAMLLLRPLEPEPKYVKEFIEMMLREILREGWIEREDRDWLKTFERNNYILRIGYIHARRGEKATGADLFLELEGNKIIFIQSKRVDSRGRLRFDRFQLYKLIELELQLHSLFLPLYLKRILFRLMEELYEAHFRFGHPPLVPLCIPLYCLPFRISFYQLIMLNENRKEESRFFHTSEIHYTLAGRKTAHQREFLNYGLKPEEFLEKFWECEIGGPDIDERTKRNVLRLYSLLTNRLVLMFSIKMI